MSRYLDTTGKSTLGIGICARCSVKMSLTDLFSDPNAPGLMVCKDDLDEFDPLRLPARETEDINLIFSRPDLTLSPGPTPIQTFNQITPVLGDGNGNNISAGTSGNLAVGPTATTNSVCTAWMAGSTYQAGDQVTSLTTANQTTAALQIYMFTCIVPGVAGNSPPAWTTNVGTIVLDGQVLWMNAGLSLS